MWAAFLSLSSSVVPSLPPPFLPIRFPFPSPICFTVRRSCLWLSLPRLLSCMPQLSVAFLSPSAFLYAAVVCGFPFPVCFPVCRSCLWQYRPAKHGPLFSYRPSHFSPIIANVSGHSVQLQTLLSCYSSPFVMVFPWCQHQ